MDQEGSAAGIGSRLRQYRREQRLSADEMARLLGISRTALYRYERGEPPKLPTIQRATAVLGLPVGSLLGVGAEWFATALSFFRRSMEVEEQAEHIFVLFGPVSFLLTSDAYDALLPELLAEALPIEEDRAPLLEVLRRRKATYRRRRPGVTSLVALPEVIQTLQEGILADPAAAPAMRAARRAAARREIEHVARLAERPPRGVQIGVLPQPVPTTGFSLARMSRHSVLAISPFRLGGRPNLATGIALVTGAADAVALHDDFAEKLWRDAAQGESAARLLRDALRRTEAEHPGALSRQDGAGPLRPS